MRHRVHGRRLGRNMAQRKALRRNLVADLICYEKVVTTEAKARMLRPLAEKMITLAKRGVINGKTEPLREVNARRVVASRMARFRTKEDEAGYYESIDVVKKLFNEVAPRYLERPGGYTRMVKIGKRPGDNADMAVLMLVEE